MVRAWAWGSDRPGLRHVICMNLSFLIYETGPCLIELARGLNIDLGKTGKPGMLQSVGSQRVRHDRD